MHASAGRFLPRLTVIAGAAVVVSIVSVMVTARRAVPFGDAFYFHYQAQLLVDGKGWFVDPFRLVFLGTTNASASHPPLWTLVLAAGDLLGLRSFFSQQLLSCVVDGAAVFVTGLAAREAAGDGAGLLAAVIAAVYPNFWVNADTGLAETLLLVAIAVVVWAALRYRRSPSLWRALVLGMLCGFAMLVRSDQVLLVLLVLAPTVLLAREVAPGGKMATLGLAVAGTALVVAPWVGFNLARLPEPEYLSSELGATLAGANCPATYSGPLVGSWSFACALSAAGRGDETQQDVHARAAAERFVSSHPGRLPLVISARLGRDLSLYRPFEGTTLGYFEGRSLWPARVGAGAFWVLTMGAVVGAMALARARTLAPFAGIALGVVVVAAGSYGSARLRTPLEVVLVVLSAVAVDRLLPSPIRRAL